MTAVIRVGSLARLTVYVLPLDRTEGVVSAVWPGRSTTSEGAAVVPGKRAVRDCSSPPHLSHGQGLCGSLRASTVQLESLWRALGVQLDLCLILGAVGGVCVPVSVGPAPGDWTARLHPLVGVQRTSFGRICVDSACVQAAGLARVVTGKRGKLQDSVELGESDDLAAKQGKNHILHSKRRPQRTRMHCAPPWACRRPGCVLLSCWLRHLALEGLQSVRLHVAGSASSLLRLQRCQAAFFQYILTIQGE